MINRIRKWSLHRLYNSEQNWFICLYLLFIFLKGKYCIKTRDAIKQTELVHMYKCMHDSRPLRRTDSKTYSPQEQNTTIIHPKSMVMIFICLISLVWLKRKRKRFHVLNFHRQKQLGYGN